MIVWIRAFICGVAEANRRGSLESQILGLVLKNKIVLYFTKILFKVVFFGLATNALNVRNNNNDDDIIPETSIVSFLVNL